MPSSGKSKGLIFLVSAGVTSGLFINFCALVFQCGCRSLWAGADAMCNVHMVGMRHCPWCEQNPAFGYTAMVAAQALISFWPAVWSSKARLALALAAFPVLGGIAAVAYGVAAGYWKS